MTFSYKNHKKKCIDQNKTVIIFPCTSLLIPRFFSFKQHDGFPKESQKLLWRPLFDDFEKETTSNIGTGYLGIDDTSREIPHEKRGHKDTRQTMDP